MVQATVYVTGRTRAARDVVQRDRMSVCSPKPAERWNRVRYVGIDIGKWKCRAAVMDPEGSIIEEFTFPNDAEGIHDLASRLTT